MRTLAFTNQKGGTAKTTSAVSVAAALGEKGLRVLLVDLDSQASASSWLGVKDGGKELEEVFFGNGNVSDVVHNGNVPGVQVLPASSWLVSLEKRLSSEVGGETLLRKAFSRFPRGRWDFVFVDCPPSLGVLTVSSLVAVREVFVPVEVSAMALAGLAGLFRTVETVRERLNPELQVSAVLACRTDSRTNLSREVVETLRKNLGSLVLETTIRENVRLREAWSFSKPITTYAPTSTGAEDYRSAAEELLRRNPE